MHISMSTTQVQLRKPEPVPQGYDRVTGVVQQPLTLPPPLPHTTGSLMKMPLTIAQTSTDVSGWTERFY
jgi:hypothetical protein